MAIPNSLLNHYNYRSLLLCFFLLFFFTSSSARQLPRHPSEFNECELDIIDALEPDDRIESEAGLTEIWNANHHRELRCVGVSVLKRTINTNGLHLPSYVTYPELHFIEQGTGVLGMAIPGCAETYQEPQWEKGGTPQQPQDRHQKVRYVKQGDLIAIPPGVPYWTYNYGNTPIIIITLLDTSNALNQLDQIPRRFYLAGNPETEHSKKQSAKEDEESNMFSGFDSRFLGEVLKVKESIVRKLQSPDDEHKKHQIIQVKGGLSIIRPPLEPEIRSEEEKTHREHEEKRVEEEEEEEVEDEPSGKRKHRKWRKETRKHREGEGEGEEEEVVEERETKTRERHRHGERETKHGERREEEVEEEKQTRTRTREGEGQKGNSLEATICTLKLHENIADPSRADIFNPRAGRITTVNSLTLPILKSLHLSAQWVNLYKDGIYVPHFSMNANSVMYVTRGKGRVQIVNNEGKSVFNGEVKRGKLLVVPQSYAVAEQAEKEGMEFIVFKTNDRAEISTMIGRDSVISATPGEVLSNVFGLSPEEVNEVKNNRNEGVLVTPDSRIHDGYIAMV